MAGVDLDAAGEQRHPFVADAPKHGEPISRADVDVEEHHVDALAAQKLDCPVNRRCLEHAKAVELEIHPTEDPHALVVVDHEDRVFGLLHFGRRRV